MAEKTTSKLPKKTILANKAGFRRALFKGVIEMTECFDISLCNPPFHTSAGEAKAGTTRKNKNLKIKTGSLNFSGKSNELWCAGGEVTFTTQMIRLLFQRKVVYPVFIER